MSEEIEKLNEQFLMQTPEEAAMEEAARGEDKYVQERAANLVAEQNAARDATGKTECIDALKNIPGTDPVLAAFSNEGQHLPDHGFIITSNIAPAHGGAIRIFHFTKAPQLIALEDTRQSTRKMRARFRIEDGALHSVVYENPNYLGKDVEPIDRDAPFSYEFLKFSETESVALKNGGRLLDERAAMAEHSFSGARNIEWLDPSSIGARITNIPINRVVSDEKTMDTVLAGLGFGMGLEASDIAKLTEVVRRKVNVQP